MSNHPIDEFAPVTPGEILAEEFLAGYELTQAALARALGISPNRIAEIIHNRRRITADTALRLGLFFGMTPEFWQNLQSHYDLKMARRALSTETAEWIASQSVCWPLRPQYGDDLPMFPNWASWCEHEHWFWATRLESSTFGVDVIPVPELERQSGSTRVRFHVELIVLGPSDQWPGPVIQEKWTETLSEALNVALEYREQLVALAAEAIL